METMSYIQCDVPAGMNLREWRRTSARARRRRFRIHLPHVRHH
jgi:hypothetical protein